MRFSKMQGLGNDYLYVCTDRLPDDADALSRRLSDRHFGPGADGMIWILPSQAADVQMRIFNADGSEAKMCGNGVRCVGKYVYERGLSGKTELTVETLSGIKTLRLFVEDGKVLQVAVEMGKAQLGAEETVELAGETVACRPVDMGNPHAVVFVPEITDRLLHTLGPAAQASPRFPGGVNLELVCVEARNRLRMRVWERGSGITLACGTGACASAAAAAKAGLCDFDKAIEVLLDGGALLVRVEKDGHVTMTGPAEFVYDGEAFI